MPDQPAAGLSTDKTTVLKMARTGRRVVSLVLVALPSAFAWLSIQNTSHEHVMTLFKSKELIVWKTAAFVYFFSWILGALSDLNDQESVYVAGRDSGKVPLMGIVAVLVLALAGWVLLGATTFERFALALAAFMLVYLANWVYLKRVIAGPLADASIASYAANSDFAGLEKVRAVKHFLIGRWQVARFLLGGTFAAILLVLAYAKIAGLSVLSPIDEQGWIAGQSLALLLFVLVMDGWLWFMRIRMKAVLNAVDMLKTSYILSPVTPARARA